MRLLNVLAATLAVSLLAACAPLKRQAFNRDAATDIHTVIVTEPVNQDSYEAAILGHPASGFGLIGALVAATDMSAKSVRLTTALDVKETRLQERFCNKLADDLHLVGYETRIVAVPKGTSDDQLLALAKKNSDGGDAVIEVSVVGGYWAAGASTDYVPRLLVKVKSVDAHSGATLYEDTLTYGYSPAHTDTVHLESDQQYRFATIDALVADPVKTRAGLYEGIDAIAGQIAADLKKN